MWRTSVITLSERKNVYSQKCGRRRRGGGWGGGEREEKLDHRRPFLSQKLSRKSNINRIPTILVDKYLFYQSS